MRAIELDGLKFEMLRAQRANFPLNQFYFEERAIIRRYGNPFYLNQL